MLRTLLLANATQIALCCSTSTTSAGGLFSWITNQHSGYIGPICARPSGVGGGDGIFVTRDVEEGEALFTVPATAWVTVDKACADSDIGATLAVLAGKGEGGATVSLAAFLAKMWLCDGKKNEAFGPYLCTLPWAPDYGSTMQEHTLWWSDEQVSKLSATLAHEDVVGLREEVALAIHVLRSTLTPLVRSAFVRRGDVMSAMNTNDAIDSAVRAAFVSILSRSFQENGESHARLVPILDVLQHSREPNVSHLRCWDPESGDEMVLCTARSDLKSGTELFNCCAA